MGIRHLTFGNRSTAPVGDRRRLRTARGVPSGPGRRPVRRLHPNARRRSPATWTCWSTRSAVTGRVRVAVDSVFPLRDAAAAHARAERGHLQGKIVLNVTG
ncbi:zinc-binding dehydrogenase [Streptomyces sp. NPDC004788]